MDIIGILSLAIAVIGTIIATVEYQKRHRIEKYSRPSRKGFPVTLLK